MKTSFFLTPDLKERAVDLAYRDATNRTLHPWANQIETIEQDPTKGMQEMSSAIQVLGRSDFRLHQFVLSSEG